MSSTALHGVTRRKQKGGLTMSWDRRINPSINPNAGKPYRFQRQKGGQSQGQIKQASKFPEINQRQLR